MSNFSNEINYVLDIGGHHGEWSFNILDKFNVNKIYIVEANKVSFQILNKNIYKNNLSKNVLYTINFLIKKKRKFYYMILKIQVLQLVLNIKKV